MANTIEQSLRNRASKARYTAMFCIALAILILLGYYVSLPWFTAKILTVAIDFESQLLQVGFNDSTDTYVRLFSAFLLVFSVLIVLIAAFLLSRIAFIEMELTVRFNGLADALCISGKDFSQLEKAAALLAPKTKYVSDVFSTKYVSSAVAECLKQIKK